MTKLCIYHKNCLDGFASAWIVNNVNKHYREDIEFHAASYNDKTYPNIKDKDVVIVDFSYKREALFKMANEATSIVILDHHKFAQDELIGINIPNVEIIFDMNRSGAMITWDYFHPNEDVPYIIKHVQDHDLWQFKFENTKELVAALYSYPFDFELWDYMSKNINSLYIEGSALLRDKLKDCENFCKYPQRLKLGGYQIPAVNCSPKYSSDVGNILSKNSVFAATYSIDDTFQIKFSLRSNIENFDWIDVNEIAKKYGGGGHERAAGFTCDIQQLLEFMNG